MPESATGCRHSAFGVSQWLTHCGTWRRHGGSGMGGIQGLQVIASRRAVSTSAPGLAAVEM